MPIYMHNIYIKHIIYIHCLYIYCFSLLLIVLLDFLSDFRLDIVFTLFVNAQSSEDF